MLNMLFNEQPRNWDLDDMSLITGAELAETGFF